MHTKSEAQELMSLLAQHDDGSKEQTLHKFNKKLCEMGCEIHQTEPASPWQNAAEGAIPQSSMGPAGKKPRRDPH